MEWYTEMKYSGVEWIQDIPENWGIRELFQLATQVKNKNRDLLETNLLSLSYGKIKRKDINNSEGLLPESFDGYNIIEANDIVLRLTDLQNDHTSLRVGQAQERGIITSAYTTLRPSGFVNPHYLYFVLHAYDLIKGFYGMGAGVRQGLNFDEVKTIKVPFPPIEEQNKLVGFLEDLSVRIDDIIEEAKRSLEEYKQWKASIVYEAVTKGINHNAKLKDSGEYWVGAIPVEWNTRKVKQVVLIENGSDPKTEGDIPVYGSGTESFKTCGEYKTGPAVLLGRKGTINIPRYVDGKYWNVDTAFNASARNGSINLKYFYYVATCFDYPAYTSKTTIPSMTQTIYNNICIPNPPIKEQEQIVLWLDKRISEIDEQIKNKLELINDLEQYKRSLIYETVTGKRGVAQND